MGYGFCKRNGCVFFVDNVCAKGRRPDACGFVVYRNLKLFCADCYYHRTCYRPYREREGCEFWLEFCRARRRVLCRRPDKAGAKVSSTG